MDLNVRGVPDSVHAILTRRAAERAMSLRAYVIEILTQHAALPTTDEWLDEIESLPSAADDRSAATVLDAERSERDAEVAHGARRR